MLVHAQRDSCDSPVSKVCWLSSCSVLQYTVMIIFSCCDSFRRRFLDVDPSLCLYTMTRVSCNKRLQCCRIGGAAWGTNIHYEALTPMMNLLPLWGQESAMVSLAQQVTALVACLGDLYAEYGTAVPVAQSNRLRLFADGIPIALHDTDRYIQRMMQTPELILMLVLHCLSLMHHAKNLIQSCGLQNSECTAPSSNPSTVFLYRS